MATTSTRKAAAVRTRKASAENALLSENATTAPKATPAKAPAAKAAPAKKTAPAKVEKAEPKVKKSDIPESERDWTYLAEKEATDMHVDFAKWLEDEVGIDVDLKTLQVVCVLRMVYQRSEANKKRQTYRPLDEAVVKQRSVHMVQAHQDAHADREAAKAKAETAAKKATPAPAARRTRKAPQPKA
jgi:hypothetical protein